MEKTDRNDKRINFAIRIQSIAQAGLQYGKDVHCHHCIVSGCWECSEFPCTGCMLDKPRIRAFAEFARRYGADKLEKCLLRNKERGIVYHYDGRLVGDYDRRRTEEEIKAQQIYCFLCVG